MTALDLQALAIEALEELKGEEITVIDVKGKTSVTDCMIIATGRSERHVKSLANEVAYQAKQRGEPALGVEGENTGRWVLVDLGDVIVHVMLKDVRDFYQLEKLWSVDIAEKSRDSEEE